MMNKTSNSNRKGRDNDFNLELFRIRLPARLGILIAILLLFIPRVARISTMKGPLNTTGLFLILTMPFQILMALVIILEYLLYKKIGARIVKYSTLFDVILLLIFTAEWTLNAMGNLNNVAHSEPVCLYIGSVLGFIAFSWRTLMVTLIVQKWQLKIIAPTALLFVTVGYAIHYTPEAKLPTLLSAMVHFLNVILIIYCEDRVKWKMVWANIQKEKWMQVNNFILNSLPENIMILDLAGSIKFISEHCKSFILNNHLPIETKEFFQKVQDLKQQHYELETQNSSIILKVERHATENNLLDNNDEHKIEETLENLITNFQTMIENKGMQEKQFLIYDGKLRIVGQQDKSLEVKISFVQHFENTYIILIIRDTTQRDLLVTLEETNKYKDQLLASVSHELRAPLNGNINLVESAITSRMIPESVKESLLIPALRSSKFLLHMINDILDMSQIKEKKLRLSFQSDNLKETLKSTAQLVELQAKKKGVGLLLEIDPSIPTRFCTDHIRLGQIVLNLLNNAIKFTKEGTVKLIAEPMKGEPNLVQVSVEDSGIGMMQEDVQKLFSSYTHIEFEGRQKMNPGGVGLGLNIAYNLAGLLGPKDHEGITVTSILGQGSTFTFILENKKILQQGLQTESDHSFEIPEESHGVVTQTHLFSKLHETNSSALIISRNSSENQPINFCSCPKILVVDDNPFNTMAFETILSSLEIKCDSVYSGTLCIKALLNRKSKPCGEKCKQYAVVFMDQEMPDMSGSETVHEIIKLQSQGLLSTIKIIGSTAHKSKEEVNKFMEAGINQCIHKPISASMIKDILKETLD